MKRLIEELKIMVSDIPSINVDEWKDISAKFNELENYVEASVVLPPLSDYDEVAFKTSPFKPTKDMRELLTAVLGLVTLNRDNITGNNKNIFDSAIEIYNQYRDVKIPPLAEAKLSAPAVEDNRVRELSDSLYFLIQNLTLSVRPLDHIELTKAYNIAAGHKNQLFPPLPPISEWLRKMSNPAVNLELEPGSIMYLSKGNVEPADPITEDYATLNDVLNRAYDQASKGKGKDRHAQSLSFDKQPIQQISNLIGSSDGLYYQAIKKIQESRRLPTVERQVAELLGAIVYIAGAIIYEEKK